VYRSIPLIATASASALILTGCGGSASQRAAIEQANQPAAQGNSSVAQPAAAAPAAPAADSPAAAGSTDTSAAAKTTTALSGATSPQTGKATTPKTDTTKPDTGKAGAGAGTAAAAAVGKTPAKAGGAAKPAAPAAPAGGKATATDTGVTANSIKLGHTGIYSGPVGSFGENLSYACRAGLQAINDSGGINGRKLDVQVRDDGWDATKGSNAVRDLVEREKVFAFACSQSVPTNDAITPYLDAQKVPNVGSDGWGEAQYAGAWSFPVGASGELEGEHLAEYQYKVQGVRTVGIIHFNNTTGEAYKAAYTRVFEALGGKVLATQAANFDDPGTTTFIAQCRTKNVDAITAMVDPGIFARMVREAAAQAYKPKFGYSGSAALYFQTTPKFTGPTAEGTIATIDWIPDDPLGPAAHAAGFSAYKDTVEKYYPRIDHSNWTKAAYVGSVLLGNALKKLGLNVTRQGIKDELDQLSNWDTGLGPKLSFSPGHHRSNSTTYLVQLKKEGNQLVWRYLTGPLSDIPPGQKN
jgi:ABC-type branched-subunit amino acid transport system substrate-binding protein